MVDEEVDGLAQSLRSAFSSQCCRPVPQCGGWRVSNLLVTRRAGAVRMKEALWRASSGRFSGRLAGIINCPSGHPMDSGEAGH